jgi:hypothetical protein
LIRPAIFDSRLLEAGGWDAPVLALLQGWVETGDPTDKRLRASRLVPALVEATVGSELSYQGRMRSKRIGNTLIYFEDLLLTSKSGLAKKFYRDHLNHMIRVTVLARALAKVCLKGVDLDEVTLAALFHDLGYPIAESSNIIEDSMKALQSCFACIQFAEHSFQFDKKKVARLLKLLEPCDVNHQLSRAVENHEHSVIGAMEFLDYVNAPERYTRVFEAIAFHDSSLQRKISLKGSPVLAALIIADEFQDWDRPIGFEKISAIDSIEPFELNEKLIRGRMSSVNGTAFSPLRQVVSKLRSLSRLEIDIPFKFELEIELPAYEQIPFAQLEELAKELAGVRKREGHDLADLLRLEKDAPVFHRTYYGVLISEETNQLITKRLQSTSSDPLVPGELLFNSDRYEILHLDENKDAQSLVITSEAGGVHLLLKSQGATTKGQLSDMSDSRTETTAQVVVGTIRALNILLRCNVGESSELRELNELLIESEQASRILLDLGVTPKSPDPIDMLRRIRSTIRQRGYFCFSSG